MTTGPYHLVVRPSVSRDIHRMPRDVVRRMRTALLELAYNPFPHGARKLQGYPRHYRLRIGAYRVIYEVTTTIRVVRILRVGHRKDVYCGL